MLEILSICVSLLSIQTGTAPHDPLIGMWESAQEDSFEFREGGIGYDYVRVIDAGLKYSWERVGQRLLFTYPEDIPDRACLFAINDKTLTLSECKIITSDLGYVEVWSGKRVSK